MKRFHDEQALMARRMKVARLCGMKPDTGARFRKLHPLDCGNPRCGICARHKRYGHNQTKQARLDMMQAMQ